MGFLRSLIFNRTVLILMIGACVLVNAMNLYLGAVRNRVLNATAINLANNNAVLIAQLSVLFRDKFTLSQTPEQERECIELFNEKLKESNTHLVLKIVPNNMFKDDFQEQAFKAIKAEKKNSYYEINTADGMKSLRYAFLTTALNKLPGMPPQMVELDFALTQFVAAENSESEKVLWVMILMAIITTATLIIFFGHLSNSADRLRKANKALEKTNAEVAKLNEELELRVVQRTNQLEVANNHLQDTLSKLTSVESFLSNVINLMPSSLMIVDDRLNIIQYNKKAEQEFSVSAHELMGAALFTIVPYLQNSNTIFTKAIQEKSIQKIDNLSYKENEEKKYADIVIYPIGSMQERKLVIRIDDATERVMMNLKLSQTDKMASLGVLTAGIAHEINNPVNFISATISPLSNDIADIVSVIHLYQDIQSGEQFEQKKKEIEEHKKSIDLETILVETKKLLDAIKNGASRTAAIVKELRAFTRSDEEVMKKANLEAGIDSTITLLTPKYKGRIEIIKHYGHLPEIHCYPGKINQVVMNILSNAIDSIPDKGTIEVTTEMAGNNALIKIKDTGTGIKTEDMNRVFEPFFTTKPINAGTGLGLSISYDIIKEHGGTLNFISEEGKGTEFVISLPNLPMPFQKAK